MYSLVVILIMIFFFYEQHVTELIGIISFLQQRPPPKSPLPRTTAIFPRPATGPRARKDRGSPATSPDAERSPVATGRIKPQQPGFDSHTHWGANYSLSSEVVQG